MALVGFILFVKGLVSLLYFFFIHFFVSLDYPQRITAPNLPGCPVVM
ncbi:hypothetical protein SSUR61_1535 [Streptococcus suis R61]|uniref:Uncharacterized protein n=1 Tax=Streptococcus suis R61 TaxID=996306 RepID=A0AA87F7B0_STRSU|nr:hypothetical protein SSUR61_1535 [Streptococcus suis R61]